MKQRHFGEYPSNWKQIARQTKEDADWKCKRCGHPHDPTTGHTLTVHHLDCNKGNCAWWNIPPLCQRCHLQIQGKVIMYRPWILPHSEWFKPYAAGYYAKVGGLPDDKTYVLANIERLLLFGQNQLEVTI